MFVLRKRMRVGGEYREAGSPIPEAADWRWQIRESYLRNGHISEEPDPPENPVKSRENFGGARGTAKGHKPDCKCVACQGRRKRAQKEKEAIAA